VPSIYGNDVPEAANNGRFYLHTNHLGSVSALSDANGQLVGGVTRYTPFGDYRSGGPNGITDRAYTGQRENMSLGLYYYNARWYSPSLARFLSADAIVPAPTSPQSLNRYAYGANSPVKYTDPTGHCPAPTLENGYVGGGNIICIAAFIPTAESEGPFGLIYEGDDRWFSENSGLNESRFWVWIDADSGDIVNSYIHPTTAVNDLPQVFGRLGGDCDGRRCTYPQWEWTSDLQSFRLEGDSGVIVFGYSVLCSHPTCYVGPGPDGNIAFIPDGDGSYYAAGFTERFPNLEAYYWKDGELQDTVFRVNHFSQTELTNDKIELETGLNMYGGFPLGEQAYYWDALPWWWNRSSLGH